MDSDFIFNWDLRFEIFEEIIPLQGPSAPSESRCKQRGHSHRRWSRHLPSFSWKRGGGCRRSNAWAWRTCCRRGADFSTGSWRERLDECVVRVSIEELIHNGVRVMFQHASNLLSVKYQSIISELLVVVRNMFFYDSFHPCVLFASKNRPVPPISWYLFPS